ncbi:MAG: hypothetical protein KJZ58_14460, partial [Flavobacteriales bacterium]|nr:hypothetical protein [Flavobacteriales bacterium]
MIGAGQSFVVIGTDGTNTNGSGSDPVDDFFAYMHYQTVYLASELSAQGMTAGSTISALGFSISEDNGPAFPTYTIRLAHTTATNSAAHNSAALSTVFGPASYNATATAAGVFDMITFSTGFVWNGSDNILVDICTGSTSMPYATPYGGVRAHTMSSGSRYVRSDSGGNQCGVTTSSTNGNRPQIRFNYTPGAACSGTPNAGSITTPQSICAGNPITLTATGLSVGTGISYQWEESPDGLGSWSDVVGGTGATTASYTTTAINATRYFRIRTNCSTAPGYVNNSNVVTVNALGPISHVYTVAGYTESFESTWANRCSTQDAPGSAWWNSPASGYNTWRRNDDNTSGGWQYNTGGAYSPAASNGSNSARFHSYGATSGMKGQLDLYLDMSAASGNEDLRFDWINPTGTDVLKVFVSTDGGANFTQLGANMGVATSWTEAYRNVTSTSATTVIRFEATSDYGNDDIGL